MGAEKVLRFLRATAPQGQAIEGLRAEVVDVNGLPAVVAWVGDEPYVTMSPVLVDGLAQQVLVVRNPDELRGLALP